MSRIVINQARGSLTMPAKEVTLVHADGTLTDEGVRLFFDKNLSPAQKEVLHAQALRQEVFGMAPTPAASTLVIGKLP